jgi:hypothetical protein
MGVLATSFTVSGLHGWLILVAAVLFFTAAVVAWVTSPRVSWAALAAAGLCLVTLALLITGLAGGRSRGDRAAGRGAAA